MMKRWKPVVVAALAALGVAALGGSMTDIGMWYLNLKQPPWKPPDRAFGPVWTTIFMLCAAAGVIGWRRAAQMSGPGGRVEAATVPDNAMRRAVPAAHPPASADLLRKRRREWMVALFAANAILNVFWSLLYFRLHRPDWSLYEVPLLWLSVLALIFWLWPFARTAALLLVPYLAWVALAAALNWQTVVLNGPFAGR